MEHSKSLYARAAFLRARLVEHVVTALPACLVVISTQSASAAIQFDIDGHWKTDNGWTMQCTRTGEQATCVMVNGPFSHVAVGGYISPTTLHMLVTRRNRTNDCVTHLDAYATMRSNDAFDVIWRASDSNCDLAEGQPGTDPLWTRS